MDDQDVGRTARVRYRLTEQGHRKLVETFTGLSGEKRKFYTVSDLDPRTVARIYYNQEPFDLGSLMVLFRVLKLGLVPDDYAQAARLSAAAPRAVSPSPSEVLSDPVAPLPGADASILENDTNITFAGEPDGGAELLDSAFYIERVEDELLHAAIRRQDSTILIKGPHHCGKSSLLARGLHKARSAGYQTVCTDFDILDSERLQSKDSLYRAFAGSLALQSGSEDPGRQWKADLMPAEKLEYYLRGFFKKHQARLVWAMDGVEMLVGCGFHEEVFSMFRAWHNARSNEPDGPWDRLTLILTCGAEASLLISSSESSPFNVATPVLVGDFSPVEMRAMNGRYGFPLASEAEQDRLFALCGGHPFLTRLALFEIKNGPISLLDIERTAGLDGGLFRPYLDEIRAILQHDTEYRNLVSAVAAGKPIVATAETNRCFQRLRSAGILTGESVEHAAFRCDLYRTHFRKYSL